MAVYRLPQPVVDAARQRHAGRGVDPLQARVGMRENLQVDAGLVHLFEPQGTDVVETLGDAAVPMLLQLAVLVMFFERDDMGFERHYCPSLGGFTASGRTRKLG